MTDIDPSVRLIVLGFMACLADKEYETLAAMTKNVQLSADEIRAAVELDGRTIIRPTDGEVPADIEVRDVGDGSPRTVRVSVPLWTAEDGLSDIWLDMSRIQVVPGTRFWSEQIHSIGIRART